jgi:hypothetical protein
MLHFLLCPFFVCGCAVAMLNLEIVHYLNLYSYASERPVKLLWGRWGSATISHYPICTLHEKLWGKKSYLVLTGLKKVLWSQYCDGERTFLVVNLLHGTENGLKKHKFHRRHSPQTAMSTQGLCCKRTDVPGSHGTPRTIYQHSTERAVSCSLTMKQNHAWPKIVLMCTLFRFKSKAHCSLMVVLDECSI